VGVVHVGRVPWGQPTGFKTFQGNLAMNNPFVLKHHLSQVSNKILSTRVRICMLRAAFVSPAVVGHLALSLSSWLQWKSLQVKAPGREKAWSGFCWGEGGEVS